MRLIRRWGWDWTTVNALLVATIVLIVVDDLRAALLCSLVNNYLLVTIVRRPRKPRAKR